MQHVTLDTIEGNTGEVDALELDDLKAEDAQRMAQDRAVEALSRVGWSR